MMNRIAEQTEIAIRQRDFGREVEAEHPSIPDIIADAAYQAARRLGASAIAVFTAGGASARLVAKYRPPVPVIAFTPLESAARQLTVSYGITSIVSENLGSTDEMLAVMDRLLQERGLVKKKDPVVFVAGQPIGRPGTTNMFKVHRIGEAR